MTRKPRKPSRAAIYCRISEDRDDDHLAVERQERLCRDLAADRGWQVARTFINGDVSASNGESRPQYEAMLAAIESGSIDAIIVRDQDRLVRRPVELERIITLTERMGAAILNVAGQVDLSTPNGRLVARMLGAAAAGEVEAKVERQKRKSDQLAAAGKPHPGPRPFGYEPDQLTIREDEAALLRDAAERILAGESLTSLAREWNRQGIPTARGNAWTPTSLRKTLTGPRVAGLRAHRGEVVGEPPGPPSSPGTPRRPWWR